MLFKDMQNGLIRPHMKEALHEIKAKHKNVEFLFTLHRLMNEI